MATTTLTGTQLLPYLSGRIDALASATQIRFRQPGTGMRFRVTGTDCTLTGTWSGTQPFLLFVDGVQQTTPTHASGVLTLFSGLADAIHTVELRLQSAYSGTGNYLVPANNSLVATGAAPAVVADTTWGPQRAVHAGFGILSTLCQDIAGTLIGPAYGTTSFPSMSDTSTPGAAVNGGVRFRARADRIYFYTATTTARWYSLYRDGVRVASVSATASVSLVYQWFEIANGLDDGLEHDWEITAGGNGGGAQSLDMIMIGGASAAFSSTSPDPRECILCIGDSNTVAVTGTGGGADDTLGNATYAWGAVLGRLLGRDAILAGRPGAVCANGARQIAADIRMTMAACGRMPAHIAILYGRNNTDTATTQADYTTMLQQALAVPQFTGKIVGITVPQTPTWTGPGALVNAGIRNAIAAVASSRIVTVEGAAWTDIGTGPDNTHYTITGQALLGQRVYDSGALAISASTRPIVIGG